MSGNIEEALVNVRRAMLATLLIRIGLFTASLKWVSAARLFFALEIVVTALWITIPRGDGIYVTELVATLSVVIFALFSFDGLVNTVCAEILLIYTTFYVKPHIYGQQGSELYLLIAGCLLVLFLQVHVT